MKWISHAARGLAITFWSLTVGSGAVLFAATESPGGVVNTEGIVVSLPVFIVSLGATASFTWMVARHDAARSREVEEMRVSMHRLAEIVAELEQRQP